jgi:hypothetical protein
VCARLPFESVACARLELCGIKRKFAVRCARIKASLNSFDSRESLRGAAVRLRAHKSRRCRVVFLLAAESIVSATSCRIALTRTTSTGRPADQLAIDRGPRSYAGAPPKRATHHHHGVSAGTVLACVRLEGAHDQSSKPLWTNARPCLGKRLPVSCKLANFGAQIFRR